MRPQPGPLSPDARLRSEIADLLGGGHAHVPPADALGGVPEARVNERPGGSEHSLWDLLYHLRVAQADILDFVRASLPGGAPYAEKGWPASYWPAGPAARGDWKKERAAFLADLEAFRALVRDPFTDLTGELSQAPGYTVVREALLAADHTSYHLGQLVALRRALGLWKPE